MRRVGWIQPGHCGETIPDFHIIDPLVDRHTATAIKIRHHDAVDGRVQDTLVWSVMIGDHLAVDAHPDAAISSTTAVPENLEFEPFSSWHRLRAVIYAPKYLIRKATV